MKLNFWTLVMVALVVAAVTFAVSPWFAFRALRSAAQNQDIQALGQLVDYNAVRGGLRSQVRPSQAADIPPPNIWSDPIGAMRHALEQPLQQQPQVDAYLTPASLGRMADGLAPTDPRARSAALRWPTVLYWDPNRCRIAVEDPDQPARRTIFTFERRGIFEWVLVQIRLPSRPAAG